MANVSLGKKVPDFKAEATGEKSVRLADFKGSTIVLFFYPKDSTPGCTKEGQEFRDHHDAFRAHDTVILGVSRDSIKSHERFRDKHEFPFDLLSDPEETLCNTFDVIKEKNMYGRKVMGIERSTFLIDKTGKLQREWRRVKVDGHVAEVLEAVQAL